MTSSFMAWASMLPLLFMRMARTLRDMAPPEDFTPSNENFTLPLEWASMFRADAVAMAS